MMKSNRFLTKFVLHARSRFPDDLRLMTSAGRVSQFCTLTCFEIPCRVRKLPLPCEPIGCIPGSHRNIFNLINAISSLLFQEFWKKLLLWISSLRCIQNILIFPIEFKKRCNKILRLLSRIFSTLGPANRFICLVPPNILCNNLFFIGENSYTSNLQDSKVARS